LIGIKLFFVDVDGDSGSGILPLVYLDQRRGIRKSLNKRLEDASTLWGGMSNVDWALA
jgi:hypothetical protein